MPPFHKEVQCPVQYYTELGVSCDQATGFVSLETLLLTVTRPCLW